MTRNARRLLPHLRADRLDRIHGWRDLLRREGRQLIAGLLVSLALFGFVSIADEVVEGETHAFDETIMLALRDAADPADPLGPAWLELTARDLTALGGIPVLTLVTLLTVVYLLMVHRRGAALLVTISVGGGVLLNTVLKQSFDRPRPDLVPHGVEVLTASFPSGHAMMTAIAYLTLAALLMRVLPERRLKAFVLGAAALIVGIVGLSRVYLGVHWPTDVLAGWTIGFAWATAWWLVAAILQRRGRLAGDRDKPGPVTRPSD